MRPKSELVANYRKAYVAIKTYPFIYTAAMLAHYLLHFGELR